MLKNELPRLTEGVGSFRRLHAPPNEGWQQTSPAISFASPPPSPRLARWPTKDISRELKIFDTDRLTIRELNTEDAAFILQLVNEPAWLRFIGDRGIRTLDSARDYVVKGPMEMYARLGFGLWLVELQEGMLPIGICGLIKREVLADVDLGFAFLSRHQRKGYAYEAAGATMDHAKQVLGITKLAAITTPDNESSRRLLEKLGFCFERMLRLSDSAPEVEMHTVLL